LSEYLYPIPIEKSISKRDNEVKLELPASGVNIEGWMQLNPEFLALKLSFGDDSMEKHALIRCSLSKEMEVAPYWPKPKPRPDINKKDIIIDPKPKVVEPNWNRYDYDQPKKPEISHYSKEEDIKRQQQEEILKEQLW